MMRHYGVKVSPIRARAYKKDGEGGIFGIVFPYVSKYPDRPSSGLKAYTEYRVVESSREGEGTVERRYGLRALGDRKLVILYACRGMWGGQDAVEEV
jgi:hypothetical protein